VKFGLQHPSFSFDYTNDDASQIVDSLKNLVTRVISPKYQVGLKTPFWRVILFRIIFEYSYIFDLYTRAVIKFSFVIALIIGVGAMLVIASPIGHVAKASTCSVSSSVTGTVSSTTSGSCSTGVASSQSSAITVNPHGGSKSSCSGTSTSTSPSAGSAVGQDSNGAVSCSAHSP